MTDLSPPPVGDHRSAKAQAKAAKAHAKALRPWFKKKRFMIPLVLVVVMVLSVAAGGGGDDETQVASEPGSEQTDSQSASAVVDAEGAEADDVAVESCGAGEYGYVEMKLKVTNNSSKRSTYSIDVVLEGADGSQIDSGYAFVDNLEPGQSTVTDAGLLTETPEGEFSCRIVQVDRMAAF